MKDSKEMFDSVMERVQQENKIRARRKRQAIRIGSAVLSILLMASVATAYWFISSGGGHSNSAILDGIQSAGKPNKEQAPAEMPPNHYGSAAASTVVEAFSKEEGEGSHDELSEEAAGMTEGAMIESRTFSFSLTYQDLNKRVLSYDSTSATLTVDGKTAVLPLSGEEISKIYALLFVESDATTATDYYVLKTSPTEPVSCESLLWALVSDGVTYEITVDGTPSEDPDAYEDNFLCALLKTSDILLDILKHSDAWASLQSE